MAADGEKLHRSITADRWCVSKEDLYFLRKEILSAVKSGQIHPTDLDPFDPADEQIGPNLYTVNELYIKPVTHAAGNCSWALMRNPQGLGPCDLFITHAWQEGVYELIDKVLSCWPRKRTAAFICILANPQNLDIGDMIQDPMTSPFALALLSAPDMLVIPNHSCSIYCRLWCVFEAYLGFKLDKTIFEASAPLRMYDVLRAFRIPVLFWLLGLLLGGFIAIFFGEDIEAEHWFNNYVNLPIALVATSTLSISFLMQPGKQRLRCVSFGALFCGLHAVLTPLVTSGTSLEAVESWNLHLNWSASEVVLHCLEGSLIFACLCSQVDHLRLQRHLDGRAQLSNGYTGSTQDATCSSPADDMRIRKEIRDQLAAVDNTVHILMHSGMSTRSLRELGKRGIDISHGGFVPVSAALAFGLAWFLWLLGVWRPGIAHVTQWQDFQYVWAWEDLPMLLLGGMIPCLRRDARAFAVLALVKLIYPFAVVDVVLTSAFTSSNMTSVLSVCTVHLNSLVLGICVAGPRHVARIPVCGTRIARAILEPCSCMRFSKAEATVHASDLQEESQNKQLDKGLVGSPPTLRLDSDLAEKDLVGSATFVSAQRDLQSLPSPLRRSTSHRGAMSGLPDMV
eukprot:TRINITY_DN9212_c0_g1_i1.p1 TRINITY_DN9212_c0_g1~~TRINITY_DN9212_c0_g1_i1.p1  ORF type:complete len:638 (+),score=104.59 TRINITY_DN9212_c0_g1_i1:48-1916(+)